MSSAGLGARRKTKDGGDAAAHAPCFSAIARSKNISPQLRQFWRKRNWRFRRGGVVARFSLHAPPLARQGLSLRGNDTPPLFKTTGSRGRSKHESNRFLLYAARTTCP